MWPNPNQILWRSSACIKMQTLETFSVITVHVRIFSGLDRNDLMYSLRICEIFLFMNAKVLFLVICLVSAILYVTRYLVMYEGLCFIFGRSRHEKKKIKKKNATQNLTRCPHGPSNKFNFENKRLFSLVPSPFTIKLEMKCVSAAKLQNYKQPQGGNKKWCHFSSNVFWIVAAVAGHVT